MSSASAIELSSDLGIEELLRRGATAWREASSLRECTQRLQDRFEVLGLLRLVRGRSDAVATPPARTRTAASEPQRPPPSQETYRRLFQSFPIPCLCSDGRGVVRDVNEAAVRLFNVPIARLVGKPLAHFVARGDTRSFHAFVRDLEAAPDPLDRPVHFRPRGGRPSARMTRVIRLGRGSFGWLLEELHSLSE